MERFMVVPEMGGTNGFFFYDTDTYISFSFQVGYHYIAFAECLHWFAPLNTLTGGEESKSSAIIPVPSPAFADIDIIKIIRKVKLRNLFVHRIERTEMSFKLAFGYISECFAQFPKQCFFYKEGFLF